MYARGSGVPVLPAEGKRHPRGGAVEKSLGKCAGVYEMETGRVEGEGIAVGKNSTCKDLEMRQNMAWVGGDSVVPGRWNGVISAPLHQLLPRMQSCPSLCPDLL